jgi:hypothetical protein
MKKSISTVSISNPYSQTNHCKLHFQFEKSASAVHVDPAHIEPLVKAIARHDLFPVHSDDLRRIADEIDANKSYTPRPEHTKPMVSEEEVLKKLCFFLRKDILRVLSNKEDLVKFDMHPAVKHHVAKSYDKEIVQNNQWLQKCINKLQMLDELTEG